MKTFENTAAQGDLMLVRVNEIPTSATKMSAESGKFILAHSETGHNHVVMERSDISVFSTEDPLKAYLEVGGKPADLLHERSFDTHKPIRIPTGMFELRRQREHTAEGFRRASD